MTTFASAPAPAHAAEWCTPVGCVPADLLDPVVVVWAGLVTLAALVALTYLPRAQAVCDAERTRTHDEQAAFEGFARQVSALDPATDAASAVATTARADVGPGSTPVQSTPPLGGGDLERIRRAYRESVMAVPHYEAEYNEPLARNLAVEFGENLARTVVDGTRLTPQLQTALVERSRESARERASFVAALEREQASITTVSERLQAIESTLEGLDEGSLHHHSYEELLAIYRDLDDQRVACRDLLDERQTTIQEGYHLGAQIRNRFDGVDFHTYLYQSMEVRHPVLAEITAIETRVTAAHDRVVTELARRV